MTLRRLTESDWLAVREVYRAGIESGDATFETEIPSWAEWDAARHPSCRIVAEEDGEVVGFVSLSPASTRPVYSGVCEVMVYVAAHARGRGFGGSLMAELVTAAEAEGIWTLQASTFPENLASIRAHQRVGFRILGTRERIGRFHDGRWRDTVILERRSEVAGLD